MIDLPTPELSAQWTQVDQRIHAIVSAIEEEAEDYGETVRVTSLIRKGIMSSPHYYGRACDLSVSGWTPQLVGAVLQLNRRFRYPRPGYATIVLESPYAADLAPYEVEFPCPLTMWSPRASAIHIHIQVPEEPTPEWSTLPNRAYNY